MNIDNLEAFIYVVHLNSIHKAADALFLSQPTVTARIKTLERELESELFERQGRSLVLNEKGKEFFPFAEQIITTLESGKKQLKKASIHEEITIGANIVTSQYFIPYALPQWKKAHPHLRYKVISASNDALVEKLLQKQIDFAFIKEVDHNSLIKQEVLDNSVQLVIFPGHHFEGRTEITPQELAKEPLVFFECGAFDWNRVHKIFEVSKIEPRIEFQVDHLEVAKSLILSGNGIGFLPRLCIKKEVEQGKLIEVDVSDLIQLKQSIYLTQTNTNSEQFLFWDDVRQAVEEFEKHKNSVAVQID
ncbi:LysR family transcriptional regulator [Bacillus sp. T3]|uniref:LysR family transcriptional regulator n=1 Tax=Bacillus sp. T3 TaxID=467262 RepID=UPI0029824BCC|nr:LysR family transcriptional regulator [Bacillus sp. T3]